MAQTLEARGRGDVRPVPARIRSHAPCSADLEARAAYPGSRVEVIATRTVLHKDDGRFGCAGFLLSGWACRFQDLYDGRRQVFDILLPGDGFGYSGSSSFFEDVNVLALTPLRLSNTKAKPKDSDYDRLQAQTQIERKRALRQIIRLGQMSALERLADLFLELQERLEVIGQTEGACFACPLTQETLADMTGLSVVHTNRTLQELRRRDLIVFERGWVRIIDTRALAVAALGPSSDNGQA